MRTNLRLLPAALLLVIALLALPAAASADGTGTTVPLAATQGKAFDGTVANFADVDDHYFDTGPSASVDWGDGTNSIGTVTGDRGAKTWSVAGSHVYAKAGTFQVVVTLHWHDADRPRDTIAAGPITVASGLAPLGTTIRTPLGTPFSGDIGAFRDDRAQLRGTNATFSASVDWGDGTPQTPAEIDRAADGTYHLVSGHSYASAGYFRVRASIGNGDGTATTVVETLIIVTGDPKPSFTTNGAPCANVPVSFTSTTATSPGAEITDYQWKIDDPSAFGQPNGGKPYDTLSTPSLDHTFVYSSVEMGLGTDDNPPPELPLRLHRNPVTVTLTVTDATNVTRSVTQTVKFADDNYKPTAANPTPKGCGKNPFAGIAALTTKLGSAFKVSKTGGFKFSAGCKTVLDCLARVQLVKGSGRRALALGSGASFMRAGAGGSVRVGLNRRGRALLRSAGRLKAQLVITSLTGGTAKTTTRTITLTR
jgi:hypothetical protein